jgi:hypothetical protein
MQQKPHRIFLVKAQRLPICGFDKHGSFQSRNWSQINQANITWHEKIIINMQSVKLWVEENNHVNRGYLSFSVILQFILLFDIQIDSEFSMR